MSDDSEKQTIPSLSTSSAVERNKSRTPLALVGTAAWLALAFWWTFYLPEDAPAVPNMKLNEWGDWAAGTFAPLALLWLAVGYFQQGEELRESARALHLQEEALRLQVMELKQSVQQQTTLAAAAMKQAETAGQSHLLALRAQLLPYQPRFRHFNFKMRSDTHAILKITNRGATCAGAVVSVYQPHDVVDTLASIGTWEGTGERAFNLYIRDEKFPLFRKVKIEYFDAVRIRQTQILSVMIEGTAAEIASVSGDTVSMTFNPPRAEDSDRSASG